MPTPTASRRIARSVQRAQFFPRDPARRFAAGACGTWASHTQNGPPSVASRKYEPPVRCPAGAPLGSPPPGHHPYLVQRDALPKVGGNAVSWRVAVGKLRTRRPPHAFGSCAYSGGGPFPTPGEPGERERASPHGLAVATTPRAAVAAHLRRLLPDPERCGGVVEPSRPGESHTPPSGRSLKSGRRVESSQDGASPGW